MVLRSIGVISCAKVLGVLYFTVGFIMGGILAVMGLLGAGIAASQGEGAAFFGLIFGVGGIIIVPIFYGILGFIAGAVMAVVYNFAAGVMGGLELNLE